MNALSRVPLIGICVFLFSCGNPDPPKYDIYAHAAWNAAQTDLIAGAMREWREAATAELGPESRPVLELQRQWSGPPVDVKAFSDGRRAVYRADFPNAATEDIDRHVTELGYPTGSPSARAGDDIVVMMFRLPTATPDADTLLRRCLLHEIGHVLGLPHVNGYGVMNAYIDQASDHITDVDRRELRRALSSY